MRAAIGFLSLKSYHGPKKILLVKGANQMSQESANLFLKTLEEPPKNCFIGLCVPKLEGVLPTIISRFRKIYLPYEATPYSFSGLKQPGRFPAASAFKNRKDFALFLEGLIVSLHNQLKNSLGSNQLIEAIESLFEIYRAHNTVNINLALNVIQMRLR